MEQYEQLQEIKKETFKKLYEQSNEEINEYLDAAKAVSDEDKKAFCIKRAEELEKYYKKLPKDLEKFFNIVADILVN